MNDKDFFDNYESGAFVNKYPHRNSKPMSLERLVDCILDLEKNDVIAFDDFKKLSHTTIQKEYFGMIHPTQMIKAIIKIEDIKEGKISPSSLTTTTIKTYEDGKVKIEKKTTFF
jgi:hypothetical protein